MSPACDSCYARELAVGRWGFDVWGKDKPRRFFGDKHWKEPLRWDARAREAGERHRVFCASMADIFEDRKDLDPARERLWALIEGTDQLDWMLLTKRHDRIGKMLPKRWLASPRRNVWLGVTAENQRRAEERIPALLSVPAAVHWVSAEPLLGPINFTPWLGNTVGGMTDAADGAVRDKGVDWVIVGGESGDKPRRMDPGWARDILEQCRRRGTAFHFKQKGRVLAQEMGCKDREGKDAAEWPVVLRVQEFPIPA